MKQEMKDGMYIVDIDSHDKRKEQLDIIFLNNPSVETGGHIIYSSSTRISWLKIAVKMLGEKFDVSPCEPAPLVVLGTYERRLVSLLNKGYIVVARQDLDGVKYEEGFISYIKENNIKEVKVYTSNNDFATWASAIENIESIKLDQPHEKLPYHISFSTYNNIDDNDIRNNRYDLVIYDYTEYAGKNGKSMVDFIKTTYHKTDKMVFVLRTANKYDHLLDMTKCVSVIPDGYIVAGIHTYLKKVMSYNIDNGITVSSRTILENELHREFDKRIARVTTL